MSSLTPKKALLIHYGEIGLKGKNQADFLRQLATNINSAVRSMGFDVKTSQQLGYMMLPLSEEMVMQEEVVITRMKAIPGIVWFAVADEFSTPFMPAEKVTEHVVQLAKNIDAANKTFVVRVKRSNKAFPMKSSELEGITGEAIIEQTEWNRVKLKHPDQTFSVEIHNDQIFFYTEKLSGAGGLPVGSADKVLSLLSGGIDSPVASYLMARRGCTVDFIHFTATPLQQKDAESYKVSKLVANLSKTTGTSKLYLIPYTHYAMALMDKKVDYDLVMFRRFMVRVAELLANKNKTTALVTGDNLSQVASQTLPNIVSTDKAVDMPILRPLLGFDKQEIIEIARQIDTYELSIEEYKDCCSIVSVKPRTRSKHEALEHIEAESFEDYAGLVEKSLADATILEYKQGTLVP